SATSTLRCSPTPTTRGSRCWKTATMFPRKRVVMRHDPDGRVTEVGARTRTIPPALRRALQHRDRGCRFPGCGLRFTQGHHIRHWAAGGPTTLSNLVLLCRRHHRSVHEDGFEVERRTDGELECRRPDGRVLPNSPALPAVHDS